MKIAVFIVMSIFAGLLHAGQHVVPASAASTEGNSNEGTSLGSFSNTIQIVYGANLIAAAGIRNGDQITGLAFRVNAGWSSPIWSVTDYQIRLATSLNPPGNLDLNFVNNRGADYTVVRSGPLSYSGSEYPVGPGPNGFGPVIGFNTAYVYSGGDLLLEYTHTNVAEGGTTADAVFMDTDIEFLFSEGYDTTNGIPSVTGPNFLGTIVRLQTPDVAIPTLTSWGIPLLALSLIGVAVVRNRRLRTLHLSRVRSAL